MTRRLLAAAAAIFLAGASAAQAQEIVYDPTNYGKLIEQAETGLKQLQQLQSQVQQAQRLYDGFNRASGVNGLASVLESPALRAALPDAATFASAASGNLNALGQIGARAAQIRSGARVYTAATPDTASQALDAAGNRAALAQALGERVADAGAQRLAGLQQLQASLDTAPDARAVMDLQARLTAEHAMIANDQMRLQGLALSQAAQEKLATQQEKERVEAAYQARAQLYRQTFQ
jgi:type IV secretion system protein VirB5